MAFHRKEDKAVDKNLQANMQQRLVNYAYFLMSQQIKKSLKIPSSALIPDVKKFTYENIIHLIESLENITDSVVAKNKADHAKELKILKEERHRLENLLTEAGQIKEIKLLNDNLAKATKELQTVITEIEEKKDQENNLVLQNQLTITIGDLNAKIVALHNSINEASRKEKELIASQLRDDQLIIDELAQRLRKNETELLSLTEKEKKLHGLIDVDLSMEEVALAEMKQQLKTQLTQIESKQKSEKFDEKLILDPNNSLAQTAHNFVLKAQKALNVEQGTTHKEYHYEDFLKSAEAIYDRFCHVRSNIEKPDRSDTFTSWHALFSFVQLRELFFDKSQSQAFMIQSMIDYFLQNKTQFQANIIDAFKQKSKNQFNDLFKYFVDQSHNPSAKGKFKDIYDQFFRVLGIDYGSFIQSFIQYLTYNKKSINRPFLDIVTSVCEVEALSSDQRFVQVLKAEYSREFFYDYFNLKNLVEQKEHTPEDIIYLAKLCERLMGCHSSAEQSLQKAAVNLILTKQFMLINQYGHPRFVREVFEDTLPEHLHNPLKEEKASAQSAQYEKYVPDIIRLENKYKDDLKKSSEDENKERQQQKIDVLKEIRRIFSTGHFEALTLINAQNYPKAFTKSMRGYGSENDLEKFIIQLKRELLPKQQAILASSPHLPEFSIMASSSPTVAAVTPTASSRLDGNQDVQEMYYFP